MIVGKLNQLSRYRLKLSFPRGLPCTDVDVKALTFGNVNLASYV